jgi:acyl-CoA thioester hydrolase
LEKTILTEKITTRIRFDEVDALGIVWHGNYVKYLEDGREAWGRKFGIPYMTIFREHGFSVPIVKLNMDYKRPLHYEEYCTIETYFVDCDAAKIQLKYVIYNEAEEVVLTAETTQVFLTKDGDLQLTIPDFFSTWKKQNGF